jgi:shikimate dehydrogenase
MDAGEVIQPVVACLGFPVAGNPSQFVMERAVAQLGLDWRFVTLQVEPSQFDQAASGIRALGFAGSIFFPPFVQRALPFCDDLTSSAEISGNVRVARRLDNRWTGNDTTAAALMALMPESTLRDNSRILCLADASICQLLGTTEPTLAERLDGAFPSLQRTPAMTASESTEPEADSEKTAAREFSVVLIDKSTVFPTPKRLATLALTPKARLLFLDENDSMDRWKKFADQRNLSIVYPLDLSVQHYLETLFFLTGKRGNTALIREALEEYLNW